ncbi:MAG: restriction endonuclease [Chloroflexi bacterium GWB2_49_20]|nr:MAG: restriction endonuclease [Chloroflexi bacterium GWB2_49_20]OGN78012.1 MAG: restriction endonuclease [Chloroflexi bacterium GWC2_49_37]OGN85050.1 MAG: restriction endonuclease [Chloroflexi bacterium GWD2_49_16]HBG74914.1 restriction endonuclease [Anaerolineae bacterium]HCC78362.1 restriction endonuclease [Anaerolineae bacterium]
MDNSFFSHPILNSPYKIPNRHWELDPDGQPTMQILERRRSAEFITPIPKPRKRKQASAQMPLVMDEGKGLSTSEQQYDPTGNINLVRNYVDQWRLIPNPNDWKVTPETARLLQHWRNHPFADIRPFFCQVEAVETLIWLTEVAPKGGKREKELLERMTNASHEANPGLERIALKMATGSGKTTVMAMIIAWQTINALRYPTSNRFTRGFLVVTPGITIRDRLRVLQPNDPDSYYKDRELVPNDLLPELGKTKIVITNYHAFKMRERIPLSKGGRSLLQGRGEELNTLETEGQMLQRVMPELMGIKNILVINDEAHHCYQEKPEAEDDEPLKGEEREEAEANNEAARLWINGLKVVSEKLGLEKVVDLSATPFFLNGSGYAEGTIFPWTMSDFSLVDAIECGIVKLPRVPVADNIPGGEMPKFRNLWEHVGKKMPKKGRGKSKDLDPLSLPVELQTALDALYGHYEKTFLLWQQAGISTPPCFIIVCQNTAISKLVYDFISGFQRINDDDTTELENGRLGLFRNYDDYGNPLARPNTLLIDSEQLESGEALDQNFRKMASDEIERYRREIIQRTGDQRQADNITDQDLLREVMNTVGKVDRLGGSIRCVVSVSMLTEGWDASTVTHILGIRAFGTQLLCEQVVGRALRRQSYDLNEEGLFDVEYADILGIPFDFTAKPVISQPQTPRESVHVHAMRPERDALEIQFPRVQGYRVELPNERLEASFNPDSTLVLTPEIVGPSITNNAGIIGEGVELSLAHLEDTRQSTLLFHLTRRLLYTHYRDPDREPELHLFGQLKRITRQWLENYLVCKGETYPAQLIYQELADMACSRIHAAITRRFEGEQPIRAVLDPYNPTGSSLHVNFYTSKASRWQTDPRKCHVNWAVLDSDWEGEFCRAVESNPRVRAYIKNQGLGFEVPYRHGSIMRKYIPDFIVQVDDGHEDLLNLVVETKGYRGEDAREKKDTMDTYWVPGVNHLDTYGRWAFLELKDVYLIQAQLAAKIEEALNKITDNPVVKQ